jgi:hypothetical protein
MKQIPVVVAALALAVPVAASATPAAYTTIAKSVPAGRTPDASWTQKDLADEPRYVVTNNGYTFTLRESNGRLANGLVSYEVLPSAYRNLIGKARWLAEGATGAQPHATCDAPALGTDAAVLGWQGSEPAYAYIPFQATSAGLGDDPATWVGKVKELTGVTLTASSDLAAACTGIGGTFAPADTIVTPAKDLAAGLTAPLDAKIAELTAAKAKADKDIAALKLEATTFKVTVSSAATLQRGLDVSVTGPPNRPVFIRVLVTDKQRKALKIPYRTMGTGAGATDAKGKAVVTVQPRGDTAPVLLRWNTPVPVTLAAVSGDRQAAPVVYLGA